MAAVLAVVLWPRANAPPAKDFSAFQAQLVELRAKSRHSQAGIDAAIDVLAKPGNKEALRAAVASERDTIGLIVVVGAIAKLDDREAAPALVARLKEMASNRDAFPAGQNIAALLAEWKVKAAVEPLVALPDFYDLHGGSPPLLAMGADGARALLEATEKQDDTRRRRADGVIARFRDPEARDVLLAAAKAGRKSAVQALGNYGGEDVEAALAALADGRDADVADAAVLSLLRIDAVRHRVRLFGMLRSGDPARAALGCEAAGRFRVAVAGETLRTLLAHDSPHVQVAALEALAEIEAAEVVATRGADGSWTVEADGVGSLRVTDAGLAAAFERRARRRR